MTENRTPPLTGAPPPARVSSEQHTAQAYDLIAQRYAEVWFDRPSLPLADRFLAHVDQDALLLDAGCGPGQYTRHFWSAGRQAVGIDISAVTVAGALDRCRRPNFAVMSMARLGFRQGLFTGIWACASVPHIPRRSVGGVLREFHRVLRPDGTLFINVPLGAGYRVETPSEFGPAGPAGPAADQASGFGRFFQRYENPADFLGELRSNGFSALDYWEATVSSDVLSSRNPVAADWLNVIARRSR